MPLFYELEHRKQSANQKENLSKAGKKWRNDSKAMNRKKNGNKKEAKALNTRKLHLTNLVNWALLTMNIRTVVTNVTL